MNPAATFLSKYKPYYLNDFFFDQSMIRLLLDMNDTNILFIGNPCAGKTSLLSIMVREYYRLDKDDRFPDNNILTINNLKEQGINFFKGELKLFCQTHSSIQGRKKMVLIDDLDTITIQNQQIFCNYIDKYKAHVCFIMTCTNLQNTTESLQSRLHLIRLTPLLETSLLPKGPSKGPTKGPTSLMPLEKLATKIAVNEGLQFSPEAMAMVMATCGNSSTAPRALINIMEKIFIYTRSDRTNMSEEKTVVQDENNSSRKIDVELCKVLSASVPIKRFDEYFGHLKAGDKLVDAIQVLYEIYDYGYSVIDMLMFFYTYIKGDNRVPGTQIDLLNENEIYLIVKVLCKYINIFYSQNEDLIELAMFTGELQEIFLPT